MKMKHSTPHKKLDLDAPASQGKVALFKILGILGVDSFACTKLLFLGQLKSRNVLKGNEYNSSTKGKYPNGKEIVSIGGTENCESEKWDTEVEKDKKVSFDNVTNA